VNPAVAYLRVSTRSQGESGLGIEAQRAAVASYCQANGFYVIEEFEEIESGRVSSRPRLHDAIARAVGARAVLLIARLDRLSRSARFINELLDDRYLRFVACDNPSADRLVLGILGQVAENEARLTSIRTKQAMAAAKARGVVFGNPANLPAGACYRGARASVIARRRKRDRILERAGRRMRELRIEGASYRAIAAVLNDEHERTALGNKWGARTVWRALQRMKTSA
jgi:DNA invertase Pin-like site-specific DNA recombinase